MSRPWRCPHCSQVNPRTAQQRLLDEAREGGAQVLAIGGGRELPCPNCGRGVDLERLASGAYDTDRPLVEVVGAPGADPTCPFCGRPSSPDHGVKVFFHRGSAERSTLELPRCARCRGVHSRTTAIGCVFGALGGLPALAWTIDFNRNVPDGFSWLRMLITGAFALAIAGGLAMWIGRVLSSVFSPDDVKPEKRKYEHPRVLEMIGQGWELTEDV